MSERGAWMVWFGLGAASALVVATSGGCAGSGGSPRVVVEGASGGAAAADQPVRRIDRLAAREAAIEALVAFAQGEDPLIRANAVEALQLVPTRAEPVVRGALHDENAGVRFVAAMSVGALKLRDLADSCRELLEDPDSNVQMAAIYALTRNGRAVDPGPLAGYLRSEQPRVRAQAAYVLGEMGNASAVPMLREAGRLAPVGTASERLLVDLQIAEARYKLGDEEVAHTILSRLYPTRESDFEAMVLAAQVIGEVGLQEGAPQLVHIVEYRVSERDSRYLYPPEMRLAAAGALAELGFRDGGYIAEEYLASEDARVRGQSVMVLGLLGDRNRIEQVAGVMAGDSSASVRLAGAWAVLRLTEGGRSAGG